MTKTIIGIVAIVLIVIAIYLFYTTKPQTQTEPSVPSGGQPSGGQPTGSTTDSSVEMSSVLGDSYSTLIQEELDKLSIEQTDFNAQTTDIIANDMSQFYYS